MAPAYSPTAVFKYTVCTCRKSPGASLRPGTKFVQKDKVSEGQRAEALVPRILVLSDLAKTEHDTTVEVPLTVGKRPARIEPLLAARVPPDAEDARVAAGIGDPFHRDPEDFAARLILVLVTDVRTTFCGKQFDDMAVEALRVLRTPLGKPSGIEQFSGGRHALVAEVGRGEDDRVGRLFLVERRKGAVIHQTPGVVADREANFDALEECLLGDTTDQEGAPFGETRLGHQQRRFGHLPFNDGLEGFHHVVEAGIGAGLHTPEQVILADGELTQLTVGDKSFHCRPRRDSSAVQTSPCSGSPQRRMAYISRSSLWRIRKVLSKKIYI
jgi:hypothetical protein